MFNLNITDTSNELSSELIYDLIIVGSGPAGFSAAVYAARKGLIVGIIGEHSGGQVSDTSSVENYLGFEYATGEELSERFKKHAESLDIKTTYGVHVKEIKSEDIFSIIGDNYMTYKSKTVLIATGSRSRLLEIPGEKEFYGKGVSYCAICDGPLYKGQKVVIAGGGNSAVEAAIDLSKIAKEVILVHRSQFRADQILINQLKKLNNVSILLNTSIKSIHGDKKVTHISTSGGDISTSGVLVEIGYVPNTQFLRDVSLNERNELIIDADNHTNIKGMFAAGDVTNIKHKQIVIAAAEGAKAALAINDYLNKNKL
jgi:alkyl hydroperoxide reductase subunit F